MSVLGLQSPSRGKCLCATAGQLSFNLIRIGKRARAIYATIANTIICVLYSACVSKHVFICSNAIHNVISNYSLSRQTRITPFFPQENETSGSVMAIFLLGWTTNLPKRVSVKSLEGYPINEWKRGQGHTVRVTSRVCTHLYVCVPMCTRSAAWARCLLACMQMPDNPVSMRMDFRVCADWVFTRPVCHYILSAHVCTLWLSKLALTLSVQSSSCLHAWVWVSARENVWVNLFVSQVVLTKWGPNKENC